MTVKYRRLSGDRLSMPRKSSGGWSTISVLIDEISTKHAIGEGMQLQ